MIDFGSLGASFMRDLQSQVDELLRSRLSGVSAPVPVQANGLVASSVHNIVNFTGAGVSVTDDSPNRRVNVNIPGSVAFSRKTVLVSAGGAGSVLVSASTPANDGTGKSWRQVGYSLAGWSASVAVVYFAYPGNWNPPGAATVSNTNADASGTQVAWLHHEFTLTAADLSDGLLDFAIDGSGEVYINDTLVATDSNTGAHPYFTAAIPSGLLVNGTNVIAVRIANQAGGTPNPTGATYRISVSTTGQPTLTTHLTSNVTVNTTDTAIFNLGLTAGTWIIWAGAHIVTPSAAGSVSMQLTDGTNGYGSAGATTAAANFQAALHITSEPIVVTSTMTVTLMAQAQASSTALAATVRGSYSRATFMRAMRIG
jgi:hypothetical protein